MKDRLAKALLVAIPIALASYVLSYVAIASGGGYVWVRSGQCRLINYLADVDMLVWQPRVGTFYPFRNASGKDTFQSDWIGTIYSPLILFHQSRIAPSIRTLDPSGAKPPGKIILPRRDQLHPSVRKELAALETGEFNWEKLAEKLASGK